MDGSTALAILDKKINSVESTVQSVTLGSDKKSIVITTVDGVSFSVSIPNAVDNPTLLNKFTVVNGEVYYDGKRIAEYAEIPTATSQLTNDSGFITSANLPNLTPYQPKNDSDLNTTNKTVVGAINELKTNVNNINVPTKTSQLTNDSGYITNSNIPTIPTKVSQLANDSDYVTQTEMTDAIAGAVSGGTVDLTGYQKSNDINLATTNKTVVGAINELKDSIDNFEGSTGEGLTNEEKQQLADAYAHSQSPHVSANDIPTKVSDLENDSSFVTQTEMTNAINNAQLGGGSTEVDLSIYQTIQEDTLTTTAKTIPEAINELKSGVEGITVPTKVSELTNDSGYITSSDIPTMKPEVICTFTDAYTQWCKGEKFPIAFFGDSTIDGNTTTGYVANTLGKDSTSTNTFCNVLQSLLREECDNSILRIYNAGFSGLTLPWAVANFDKEFGTGTAYSDAKMIGIGFGINDRLAYDDLNAYREGVKTNLISLINKCYEKRIQPFLLTGQATLECGVQSDYTSTFPLRDSNSVNIANNEIRRELAKEYGLELIDISDYTKIYLENSLEDSNNITTDRLHFSDIGHKYEAGMIFAHIVPRVIEVEGNEECLITYANQNLKEAIPEEKISYGGKLKTYAQYTKSDSNDTIIMDTYIFVKDKPSTISALKTDLVNLTHIKLDEVDMDAPLDVNNLGTVDLGLHHLVAYSGASTKVDFTGFAINSSLKNEVIANGLNYNSTMGFFATDESVMPTILCPKHDKINNTTALSNYTISKIIIPIKTAGKLTISKCSLIPYGTGVSPILIDPKQYDVSVGNNVIELNISLGKNETLTIANAGDTAIPYFAMSGASSGTPNTYEYTKIYTPPQFKDSSAISSIVLCCAIYRTVIENKDIPTKISQLTNDSGYVISSDVPTKVSELTNDSSYVTTTEMNNAIANAQLGGGDGGEIDLSNYQQTIDSGLNTTSKEVVGAINEINSKMGELTIYTDLAQLKLTNGITTTTIFNTMPNNSMLRLEVNSNTEVTDIPANNSGILMIDKGKTSTGFDIQYKMSSNLGIAPNTLYTGQLKGGDGSGLTWRRICTTSIEDNKGTINFTMPSNITGIPDGCYGDYVIRDGWCFASFTVGVTKITPFANYTQIATGFPSPIKTIYPVLYSENGVQGTQITLYINSSGVVKILAKGNATSGQDFYLGIVTYPVKET